MRMREVECESEEEAVGLLGHVLLILFAMIHAPKGG